MGTTGGYRNIRRYEHHHFRGWVVSLKRGGHCAAARYFKDGPAGPEESLRRALEYRDRMVRRLRAPLKLKTRYSLNATGVIGVSLITQRTRAGTPASYYVASWNESGRKRKRSFSLHKYGKGEAFRLAKAARRQAVKRLLSSWTPGADFDAPRKRAGMCGVSR